MSVKVLLMADVNDLGSEGDVVAVSEGYARNHLLPKKLAAPVTAATTKRLEKIRREREAARKVEIEKANAIAAKMAEVSCTIPVKVSETDKLFGSVTEKDISDLLRAQGFDMDKCQVTLEKPVKELGVYEVPVRIHPEVSVTIKVWVVEE